MNKSFLDYTLRIRLLLVIFVAAVSSIATYFISRAERDGIGYSPVQPIAFSHKLHAGTMNIDCGYCHTAATVSPHATIPAVSVCMNCHAIAKKNSPEIIKLTSYYDRNIALPWKRVHRVPDYAYFNHSAHVNKGIGCVNCHGHVENMDGAVEVSAFTMGVCLDCHRNAPARVAGLADNVRGPDNCWTCHR